MRSRRRQFLAEKRLFLANSTLDGDGEGGGGGEETVTFYLILYINKTMPSAAMH